MASPELDAVAQQATRGRVQRWEELTGRDLLTARALADAYNIKVPAEGDPARVTSGGVVTGIDPRTGEVVYQTPVPTNITVNPPSQSATGLSREQVLALAPGAASDPVGNLRIQGRLDYYKPIGQDRNGQVIYDYVATPPTATTKPTAATVVGGALQQFGLAPREAAAPAQPLGTAPPAQSLTAGSPEDNVFRRAPSLGQSLLGQPGDVYMARLPTGPGGSRDINADTIGMTLAAAGQTPTGDFEKDLESYGNAQLQRAMFQATNPDMSPARIQSAFFQPAMAERSAMRRERAANLLRELSNLSQGVESDSLTNYGYSQDEDNLLAQLEQQGAQSYAEGGTVGAGFTTDTLRNRPYREGENYSPYEFATRNLAQQGYRPLDTSYTGQLYNGGRRLGMVPPWLLPSYPDTPRGGSYGPGLGRFLGRLANPNFPGQQSIERIEPEREENTNALAGNAFPQAGVEPQPRGATRSVGYAPRFANGGAQVLGEPVVGVGLKGLTQGQIDPKFVAGEAGPEMVNFTPMSAPPMNAPYPQSKRPVQLLDPKRVLMSMKRK